jgi:diphthamide synthase (EF-2-diphthine--ammonia ligase)
VVGLLATITAPYDRVSMHGVRVSVLEAQAHAVGLPLQKVLIPAPCPNEVYETAMRSVLEKAREQGVSGVAFGDLFLRDLRTYREAQLSRVGMAAHFPLWGLDTRSLAREMMAGGLRAVVTCLDPCKMPRGLAGSSFDPDFLAALPAGIDPCGENGEFHTCVHAGPMLSRPVPLRVGSTVERDGFVFTDVLLDSPRLGDQT